MRKLVTCFMGLVLILVACTNNDKDDKPQTSSSQKFPNRTVEII
ncbi:tripartite tricarboxylate transporter substrate binding protein, partial (plasmid) [Staphylococcus pseudintermedius]